jgi:hypothetical protein
VVPGSFIPFCSLRRRSFLPLTYQYVLIRKGRCLEASSSSVPLRRRSFLSFTHILYRKGWCLEASSPSVLLRRRSFLPFTHVLYRKEDSFIPFCYIAKAQLSVIDSCTVQERVVPGSFISFCSIAQAQLFAGFRIRIDLMRIRIRIRILHFF